MADTTLAAPTRPEMGIGDRLGEILVQRGWSLSRLAAETKKHGTGVSVSQISLLVRGEILSPRVLTIRRICVALEISEKMLLGPTDDDLGIRAQDLRAFEGVVSVPVVLLGSGEGGFVKTGETVGVASSLLRGRRRLLAAVVDGGGMAPHCLIGDRVVFDPDAQPRNGQLVILRHSQATLTAWYVVNNGVTSYRFADGSWLEPGQVLVAGVVIYIMRPPPPYRP